MLGSVAWDVEAASVLSAGEEPAKANLRARLTGRADWQDSALLRSYRGVRGAIGGQLREIERQLTATGGGGAMSTDAIREGSGESGPADLPALFTTPPIRPGRQRGVSQ